MTKPATVANSLPLGRRIALLVAVIAVLLAFMLQAVGLLVSRENLEAGHRQAIGSLAELMLPGVEEALLTGNYHQLPTLMESAKRANPDLVYAVICGRGGTPVAHDLPGALPGDLEALVKAKSREVPERTLFNVRTEKGTVLHLVQPLESGRIGYLHLGLSWAPVDAALGQACLKLVIAMITGLVASALVAGWAYRRLAGHMMELTQAAQAFGRGRLDTRVRERTEAWDEAAILAQAFNQMAGQLEKNMAEQLQSSRALAHAEKLSVVGQLAAGVAHEINSPLDGAIEASRILERNAGDPEKVKRFAGAQRAGLERIAIIVRRLLTFSRLPGNKARGQVTVSRVLDEAGAILKHRLAERRVRLDLTESRVTDVRTAHAREVLIPGDELGLVQVVVNLLNNAIDATPEGGTVQVGVRAEADAIKIDVTDQGSGVPDDAARKLFTPFFTTKEVGKGTGLGLAVSRNIVAEHGGTIGFVNLGPPLGARFTVTLPRREGVQRPLEPTPTPVAAREV